MDNLSVKEKEIYGSVFTWRNGLTMTLAFGTAYLALINGLGGKFSVLWLLIAGMFTSKIMYGSWLAILKSKTSKFSFAFWLGLSFIISALVAILGNFLGVDMMSSPIERSVDLWTFVGMVPAIMGEELLVIMPMMFFSGIAIKHGTNKSGIFLKSIPYFGAILLLLSSLMFGALNLPTNGWNYYQSLIGITLIRIPFTLATLQAKSIRAGFAVHYVYDTVMVLLMMIGS